MLQIANKSTGDDWTDACTLVDPRADHLDLVVANAAVVVQFKAHRDDNQEAEWGAERWLFPRQDPWPGVAGMRARSLVAGQPGKIAAQLLLPDEPRSGGGGPFSGLTIGNDGSVTPVAGSLNSLSAVLAADAAIGGANVYVDALTLALGKGTWFVVAQALISGGSANYLAKLHDGAGTVFASAELNDPSNAYLTVAAIVNAANGLTLHFSLANDQGARTIKAALSVDAAGNNATQINALQIA